MNLLNYRNDERAIAFLAIYKSKSKKIVVVEGIDDVIVYQSKLGNKIFDVYNSHFKTSGGNSNKNSVKKLKNIIQTIDPKNKNIVYLIDKDYDDDEEKPPLFITDYYSWENNLLIFDYEINEYFFKLNDIDSICRSFIKSICNSDQPKWINEKDYFSNWNKKEEETTMNELDILKYVKGKTLFNFLKKNNIKEHLIVAKMDISDFPVLKRIMNYFKLS